MIDTLRTLFRLTLLEAGDARLADLGARLAGISERDWSRAIDELDTHRTTPLIGYTLRRLEQTGAFEIDLDIDNDKAVDTKLTGSHRRPAGSDAAAAVR